MKIQFLAEAQVYGLRPRARESYPKDYQVILDGKDLGTLLYAGRSRSFLPREWKPHRKLINSLGLTQAGHHCVWFRGYPLRICKDVIRHILKNNLHLQFDQDYAKAKKPCVDMYNEAFRKLSQIVEFVDQQHKNPMSTRFLLPRN